MGVDESGRLVSHQARETAALERGAVVHAIRMAGGGPGCAVIPRRGSVDVADEAADVAGRGARLGIEVEQAGAAIGATEETAVGGRCEGAATHPPNGGGTSGNGRLGRTGHHGACYLCFLARLDRGMSDRLRRSSLMSLRAAPGAWFGRSNRVVASDGLPKKYRPPVRFRQMPDGPGYSDERFRDEGPAGEDPDDRRRADFGLTADSQTFLRNRA